MEKNAVFPASVIPGEWDEPVQLSESIIAQYQLHRCVHLRSVVSAGALRWANEVVGACVERLRPEMEVPLESRDTYGKAFLQLMNLWRVDEVVRALVFSKRLASLAAQLMQVDSVRLYHDQALFKEPGGGITPWHADQYYWPLESDKCITLWLPLQETPLEMGPLEFAAGSHVIEEGRELAISDESEERIGQRLRVTDFPVVREPFAAGDLSFHSGWVFHRAGPNHTEFTRMVMTIIYMDGAMRLKQPENENQVADWHTWCPGAVPGEEIDTPLNPVLWP